MSISEMKEVVIKNINQLNEDQLKQVNDYIKAINADSKVRLSTISHAMQIIKERNDVLAKLAK